MQTWQTDPKTSSLKQFRSKKNKNLTNKPWLSTCNTFFYLVIFDKNLKKFIISDLKLLFFITEKQVTKSKKVKYQIGKPTVSQKLKCQVKRSLSNNHTR